ncbi:MAG: hypothetical protein EOP00_20580 [Pedobacter sp.]|nr:MAG: hypothetical protein EOP00_20580 [Pedobacter sp.]
MILQVNQKLTFKNNNVRGLEPYIVNTKNSLGFRGEEPPKDIENKLSVITIGGSTTACLYLSDGKDWPNILAQKLKVKFPGIWLNNAGFDGHSTFGHQILLDDYILKLKPKYVLFLVGINDVERESNYLVASGCAKNYSDSLGWKAKLVEHLEVASLVHNLYLVYLAKSKSVTHFNLDLENVETLQMSEPEIETELIKQKKYLGNYGIRIQGLINTCRKNKIEPVFITQPLLFGNCIDPVTKKDLGKIKFNNTRNGLAEWQILELYNDVTRNTCRQKNVLYIDLAQKMPKNSAFFYDGMHFTNSGAAMVAKIIETDLNPFLVQNKLH